MDIVQNYVASDICNRPNIGIAIKGRTSTVSPRRRLLFCIALFIFPGVITVRHQRSWCGATAQGCIFSNVSSDTRLRQSFIFATYIALVKIKKDPKEERGVDEGPGCKKLYRRPRECHFKELWDLVILLPRGPPCSTSSLALVKRKIDFESFRSRDDFGMGAFLERSYKSMFSNSFKIFFLCIYMYIYDL